MASWRGNASSPVVVVRRWRWFGRNSGGFLAQAAIAALVTCAALGPVPPLALGGTNEKPLPSNPVLIEFGLSREQVPEIVYVVRTRKDIPADCGVIVHARRGQCALVSGPPEAIRGLWALPAEVVPVELTPHAQPAPARSWRRIAEADPTIQRAVDKVSWEGVLAKIQMLVDFGPRMECSPAMLTGAVPESLAAFFRGLDLDVALERYYLPHWNYCDQHPTGLNIIATQRGVDYPDSIFVMSAHYDSYRGPGADDNATGVAAVMTAAELLSRHRFAYTIQYICFGNEEYCGCGSLDFVGRAYRDHVNLVGALNFDMLGYWRQGAVYDLEVEANAPSAWLAAAFVNAAELYTDTPCDTHITDIAFSDNGSFWRFGYAALNNEEAWMGHEGDFNPHWHTKDDRIQYLHPGFTVACTRAAVAGIATLARLVPPVSAVVDISPKTLNLSCEGRWITGRIELPAEYDPRQVDAGSIRLNETVIAEPHAAAIGDGDKNGNPDLMVKFPRTEVACVLGKRESAELRVSGLVGDEYFEGTDTIRLVCSPEGTRVAAVDPEPPNDIELFQAVPNPFNPTTTISFFVPELTGVVLSVYDIEGRLVATLVEETTGKGLRGVTWDGRDSQGSLVSSGVYFYRLTAGGKTLTKKMVLLK